MLWNAHRTFFHHEAEHDYDPPAEVNGLYQMDTIELTSVGIDVGSAGTQVLFSRLRLRRKGEQLSSRYVVVAREPLHRSPVALTPYLDDQTIDAAAVGRIVAAAYAAAGLAPQQVDTGAVILTGEAIRRQNASAIAAALADRGGQFVCVMAGHRLEACLAAFGSGAALRSYAQPGRVLNIDIGGGTTKLAMLERGHVTQAAALYLGGRLLALDAAGRISRLEPGARYVAEQLGLPLAAGAHISAAELDRMAEWMADAILRALLERPLAPAIEQLYLTAPLELAEPIDGLIFSGGVAEYVYGNEQRDFGDLGRRLGQALARRLQAGCFPWPLLPAGECIRATAIGASEHTVQVSGNTIYISEQSLLPRKNLQVLNPDIDLSDAIEPQRVAGQIRAYLAAFDIDPRASDFALALRWRGAPAYQRVAALAAGIEAGLAETISAGRPVALVFDGDIARTVGSLLKEERQIASPVLVLDGIRLQEFDFIDLGQRLQPSGTVPVTIKSLVFSFARSTGAAHEHHEHAGGPPAAAGHGHSHAGAGAHH